MSLIAGSYRKNSNNEPIAEKYTLITYHGRAALSDKGAHRNTEYFGYVLYEKVGIDGITVLVVDRSDWPTSIADGLGVVGRACRIPYVAHMGAGEKCGP